MAKIGIFGGSFDPPHLGHILALEEFQRKLSLDRVIVIPAGEPPHKQLASGGAPFLPNAFQLDADAMDQLCIQGFHKGEDPLATLLKLR